MNKIKGFLYGVGICLFNVTLLGCGGIPQREQQPKITADSTQSLSPPDSTIQASRQLGMATRKILKILQSKDLTQFSRWIDPERGVRFSPYAFVDTANDIHLSPGAFLTVCRKDTTLNWGFYDGSGAPILLSVQRYFDKFVYDVAFLKKGRIVVNQFLGKGNSRNNLTHIYPGAPFTESYFPGADPKLEGMDWSCLRLVFRRSGERYYLIAVIHDQWTI